MAFDKTKFIEQFKAETREHLEALSLGMLKLESNPKATELLKEMMNLFLGKNLAETISLIFLNNFRL